MATINTLVINITNSKGEVFSPIYEVHSWEKAEEIINTTRKLIAEGANPDSTFQFEVHGQGS
jgi:hypothetical protein